MLCDEDCRTAVFGKTERTVGWEGDGDPVMMGLLRHCNWRNPQSTDRPCLTSLTHSFTLDLVILCRRGKAEEAQRRMREIMGKLKLRVNEEKTRICKVPEGEFDFLGYTFGRMYSARTGQARYGFRPSKKSIKRVIGTIHELTARKTTWQEATELVRRLNRTLGGWANYFQVGTVSKAYRMIDTYTAARLRRWLRKKHKVRRCGYMAYPPDYLYQTLGLIRLSELSRNVPCAKA